VVVVHRHELVDPASGQLLEIMRSNDERFLEVKMTREAALDSNLLARGTRLAVEQAKKLQTSFIQLDPTLFREKIAAHLRGAGPDEVHPHSKTPRFILFCSLSSAHNYCDGGEKNKIAEDADADADVQAAPLLDWSHLSRLANTYLDSVPIFSFMCAAPSGIRLFCAYSCIAVPFLSFRNGPLDIQIEVKARKVAQRQKRVDLSKAERPETVGTLGRILRLCLIFFSRLPRGRTPRC
jgi:hypothetical protein